MKYSLKYSMLTTLERANNRYLLNVDDKLITETLPVLDFMKLLIQHIPEKHFKQIRYYGIYARHRKSDQKLTRAISKCKHSLFRSFNQWRNSILTSFGYDPIKCPCCGTTMDFLELYFNHKRVPLDELYKQAMSKAHNIRAPIVY